MYYSSKVIVVKYYNMKKREILNR